MRKKIKNFEAQSLAILEKFACPRRAAAGAARLPGASPESMPPLPSATDSKNRAPIIRASGC
jgi:hypothetical protein